MTIPLRLILLAMMALPALGLAGCTECTSTSDCDPGFVCADESCQQFERPPPGPSGTDALVFPDADVRETSTNMPEDADADADAGDVEDGEVGDVADADLADMDTGGGQISPGLLAEVVVQEIETGAVPLQTAEAWLQDRTSVSRQVQLEQFNDNENGVCELEQITEQGAVVALGAERVTIDYPPLQVVTLLESPIEPGRYTTMTVITTRVSRDMNSLPKATITGSPNGLDDLPQTDFGVPPPAVTNVMPPPALPVSLSSDITFTWGGALDANRRVRFVAETLDGIDPHLVLTCETADDGEYEWPGTTAGARFLQLRGTRLADLRLLRSTAITESVLRSGVDPVDVRLEVVVGARFPLQP